MAKKPKYYVVWEGHAPGIYTKWEEAEAQVKGYPEAVFKAFSSREEAEIAFEEGPLEYIGKGERRKEKLKHCNNTNALKTLMTLKKLKTLLPLKTDWNSCASRLHGRRVKRFQLPSMPKPLPSMLHVVATPDKWNIAECTSKRAKKSSIMVPCSARTTSENS